MGRVCAASVIEEYTLSPAVGTSRIENSKPLAPAKSLGSSVPSSLVLVPEFFASVLHTVPLLPSPSCPGSNNKHESTFAAFSRKHETSRSGFEPACGPRRTATRARAPPPTPIHTKEPPSSSTCTNTRVTRVVGCVYRRGYVSEFSRNRVCVYVST